jgi:predicted metal-dependent peptidase
METIIVIEAKMTDEQLQVFVSEIQRVSEIIGIEITVKSK